MEKQLLQQALDSILHGSTRTISQEDSEGKTTSYEERINDLRLPLIEKIAEKLVKTEAFREEMLKKVFTSKIIKKLRDEMLKKITFEDLPYDVKNRIEKEMNEIKLEIREYKIVAKVIKK